jgi:ABC-type Fe3+-siderophore transport system permease subunit
MNGDIRALGALPLAAADIVAGVVMAQYVSLPVGVVLAVFGLFVLVTATYRAVARDDSPESRRQTV